MNYLIRKRTKEDAPALAHNIAVAWNETYQGIIHQSYLDKFFIYQKETEEKIINNIAKEENYYVLEIDHNIV